MEPVARKEDWVLRAGSGDDLFAEVTKGDLPKPEEKAKLAAKFRLCTSFTWYAAHWLTRVYSIEYSRTSTTSAKSASRSSLHVCPLHYSARCGTSTPSDETRRPQRSWRVHA